MSNIFSRMSAKTFRATLGNEKVTIQIASSHGLANYVEESTRTKIEESFNKKSEYFIDSDEKAFTGSVVYKMPEGYVGHHDEYDLDNFEVVGTILGVSRKYRVETCLKTVEGIRRHYRMIKMGKREYSVGAEIDKDGNVVGEPIGFDVDKLRAHWKERDLADGAGMHCEGHGLYMEPSYSKLME